MTFLTVPLDLKLDRKKFSSGKPMLDNYFYHQASQDIRRKLSICFVKLESLQIQGYYTLSSNSISQEQIPRDFAKRLPPAYSSLPTILLGRLAVDKKYQGQGIGKLLLVDALKRCYLSSKTIGSFAVIVDPLDEEAERFYSKYGFISIPDSGKMFLAMKTIQQLFENK